MKTPLTQRIVTPLGLLGMGAAVAITTGSALGGGTNYYLDGGPYPWGQSGVFQETMDTVFGLGGWLEDDYGTVDVGTLLSNNTNFIYMEGGDSSANELETFLAANQAALEAWVFAGGALFLNAAPNEGASQNWGFGGVVLTYPDFDGANEAHLDAGHPVVNGAFGAVGLDYTGNSFSHATVSGGGISPFITNGAGNAVAAELIWGQGGVVFGGMTSYNFHDPDPDSATLHWNIVAYTQALQGPPGGDCSGFPCGNNDQKVLLCHVPPGNPDNEHTICISPDAVAAHLANHPGDHCGPCEIGFAAAVGDLPGRTVDVIGDLPGMTVVVMSNRPEAFIEITLDIFGMGGDTGVFVRHYPVGVTIILDAQKVVNGRAFLGWKVGNGWNWYGGTRLQLPMFDDGYVIEAVYVDFGGVPTSVQNDAVELSPAVVGNTSDRR